MLTSAALLERRTDTYEVAERRQLPLLAALVRFVDQPQWLALEWSDGAPPSMYITPARENLLTALLDTAQVSRGPAFEVTLLLSAHPLAFSSPLPHSPFCLTLTPWRAGRQLCWTLLN